MPRKAYSVYYPPSTTTVPLTPTVRAPGGYVSTSDTDAGTYSNDEDASFNAGTRNNSVSVATDAASKTTFSPAVSPPATATATAATIIAPGVHVDKRGGQYDTAVPMNTGKGARRISGLWSRERERPKSMSAAVVPVDGFGSDGRERGRRFGLRRLVSVFRRGDAAR